MSDEVELVSDGNGLAVIGEPAAVARFLASEGLQSRPLGSSRSSGLLPSAASFAQLAADASANSGRWVQLTKESAAAVKKYGLMDSAAPGVKHAMIGKPGDIQQWVQIATGPGSMLTNPALLSGAAGIMTQMAMQQQMDQIMDYLAAIDEKLGDLIRSQKNQMLARVDGVELAIHEAMSVRDAVGRVSDVTWSKVQSSSTAILESQAYALRQLGDLADKLENKAKLDELNDVLADAETSVQTWLRELARCFRLQDAIAVLELDRVVDSSPDELDRHRLGLLVAREARLELLSQTTMRLLQRMTDAAEFANSKVLFHPAKARSIVTTSGQAAIGVGDFHAVLGVGLGADAVEARRWRDAAGESWDKVRETSAEGFDTVLRKGGDTLGQAKSAKDRLTSKLAERRTGTDQHNDEDVG